MNGRDRIISIVYLCFFSVVAYPQVPTQVIRGKVIDLEARTGLEGAHVVIQHTDPVIGAVTSADGSFRIEKVPVGRHSLQASFIGYKTAIIPEILISSGKETVLTIELEEIPITEKEVEVKASTDKDKAKASCSTKASCSGKDGCSAKADTKDTSTPKQG